MNRYLPGSFDSDQSFEYADFGNHDQSNFGTVFAEDIVLDPDPEWLIKGLLPDGGLCALWGEPGSGKSFLALDLAFAVSRGAEWFDSKTLEGGVVYLAAEAGRGVKKRMLAYMGYHRVASDLPFALVPTPVDLCTEKNETRALIDEIRRVQAKINVPLRLVVIDTLARVMAGGDENSGQDMGALIRNADVIREQTGAAVLLVHHSGKDADKKARGHSSLIGALDTAIEVKSDETTGLRTARVRKQKDGEDGRKFCFRLAATHLTDEITSCVVERTQEASGGQETARRRPTGASAIALQALQRAVEEAGETPSASDNIPSGVRVTTVSLWRKYFQILRSDDGTSEARKKAFQRARDALQGAGLVGSWGEYSWLV